MNRLLLAAVVLSLAACGRAKDQEYADAAPADFDAMALEISGASSEGALTSAEGVQRQGLDGAPELLGAARERVKALNDAVRAVVAPIAELVAADLGGAAVDNVKVYGPKEKNGVDYKLTIRKLALGRFGWKLEAKKVADDDSAYQLFAGGALVKGALPHRGRGVVGINLDVLREIDTGVKAQGKLLCGFAHVGDTKTLAYALKDFTPDIETSQPVTAAFVGHRLMPSRATSVRLAGHFNLNDSSTTAREFVRARVRFIPGVGGRADALATEGDVPVGKVYFASACWDALEQEGYAVLRLCTRGDPLSCQVVATRGQLSNCKLGLENESMPPEDATDASTEPDAPASDVGVPTVMPDGAE